MKRFTLTLALFCVLSSSAMAGDIPTVNLTGNPPEPVATPTEDRTEASPCILDEVWSDSIQLIQTVFEYAV